MRKLLLMIIAVAMSPVCAFADRESETALNLLERNGVYVSDSDILDFLRRLKGDVISFSITAVSNTDMFIKERPDTIWIKKRPKKNPQEGKHYKLSYIYKGEPAESGEYVTPISYINGKPFRVLSVDNERDGSYYSYKKDILLRLVDPDDGSIVSCRIPHNNKFSFHITSDKVDRDIKSLIGKEFYVKSGHGFSVPEYTLCTLAGGGSSILFDGHIGDIKVRSDVKLDFIDADGSAVPFKYEKQSYRSYYPDAIIVGRSEYEDKHMVRTINSDVDYELAESEYELPFDFKYILGIRNGYSAYISQRINPESIKSYSWTSGFKPHRRMCLCLLAECRM